MNRINITSVHNPIIRAAAEIRKNPSEERFLIEGTRFVEELPPDCILEVYTTDPEKHADFLHRLNPETRIVSVSPAAMKKICAAVSEQTIACIVCRKPVPRPDKLILLDHVQDPGNVGTILRTAYAFGFGAILSPGCANPWGTKVLMASAGAFRCCSIQQSPDLVKETERLQHDGYTVYAAAIDHQALPPEQLKLPGRRAIIIGSEGKGIEPKLLKRANQTVFIPMENPINSLNAACAASILLYLFR